MKTIQSIQNINDLKTEIANNPEIQQAFKDDPIKASQQLQQSLPDNWVYRMVVGSLGAAVLMVIIGIIILSLSSKPVEPTVSTLFTAIASGAVGALAGLLAPQPKNS